MESEGSDEEYDVENRKGDKKGNSDLLLLIRAKHMRLVSTKWIALSLTLQIIILAIAFFLFDQATLLYFVDGTGELAPAFFYPHTPGDPMFNMFQHNGKNSGGSTSTPLSNVSRQTSQE